MDERKNIPKMKTYKIDAYKFEELNHEAKLNVVFWMTSTFEPLEYERLDGSIGYDYWDEADVEYIEDFCKINGHLFSKNGDPIHKLITKH